jgi:hypothetical protein
MILASISARRRNADPLPYVLTDGTRAAADPVDVGNPAHWLTDAEGHAERLIHLADYAPRPEYSPTPFHPVNPILDAARDTWDDPWGSALGWLFPVCAVREYLGEPIPAELGYRSSFAGAASDLTDGSWEATEVVTLLGLGALETDTDDDVSGERQAVYLFDPADIPAETWNRAIAYTEHAMRVLNRYADAARAAGLDY